MRKYIFLLPLILFLIFSTSCRKDFDYGPSAGNLSFSKDTVFLDTVFTNISSSTYSLKVYNKTKDDVVIPTISLKDGENSAYRLNVDGQDGNFFNNVPLLAKDSLFIFIEVTQNVSLSQQSNWLYTDILQFDSGVDLQEVPLITLIKDAIFIFPKTLENGETEQVYIGKDPEEESLYANGVTLNDEQLHFTNNIPYVIYGYASVPEGKELIIDAGSRIHFHQNSGMVIQANASLQINGVLSENEELQEGEVIFEGDRLEPELANISGQWESIIFTKGSINNTIKYTTIKNAKTGIFFEGESNNSATNLDINNAKIYNSSNINLWIKNGTLNATNLVIGSAGNTGLYCNEGGSYTFTHTTIANYWLNSFREGSALKIDTSTELNAIFNNCIIDGNKRNELIIENNTNSNLLFQFNYCMIKSDINDTTVNSIYNYENNNYYTSVFLNEDALFKNSFENSFEIENGSFAINKGHIDSVGNAVLDIKGTDRSSSPDIGAYEFIDIE